MDEFDEHVVEPTSPTNTSNNALLFAAILVAVFGYVRILSLQWRAESSPFACLLLVVDEST